MRRVLARFSEASVTAEVEPKSGERWRIVTVPLPVGGEGARMAVIEDVSEVVRSNRLEAWAEMARIIAHEIKNPLTPIRLSVEHLREVWRRSGAESPEFARSPLFEKLMRPLGARAGPGLGMVLERIATRVSLMVPADSAGVARHVSPSRLCASRSNVCPARSTMTSPSSPVQ